MPKPMTKDDILDRLEKVDVLNNLSGEKYNTELGAAIARLYMDINQRGITAGEMRIVKLRQNDNGDVPGAENWQGGRPTVPDSATFLEWNGGPNPFKASMLIEVKFRAGRIAKVMSSDVRWTWIDYDDDIVGYRTLSYVDTSHERKMIKEHPAETKAPPLGADKTPGDYIAWNKRSGLYPPLVNDNTYVEVADSIEGWGNLRGYACMFKWHEVVAFRTLGQL